MAGHGDRLGTALAHQRLTAEGRTDRTVEFEAYQRWATRLRESEPEALGLFG